MIKLKRVYDPPVKSDGSRVLVDRLWPRGLSKEKAKIDLWLREVAPGHALRKWFAHDPAKWSVFKEKYIKELVKKERSLDELLDLEKREGTITLVFGAKDASRNNAAALLEFLKNNKRGGPGHAGG